MKTLVEVQNLKKNYGDKQAVKSISFKINENEILGLLGPNGSGKTTTIGMMLGLLKPTSGEILIEGDKIEEDRIKILQKINFISPYIELPKKLTVKQNLIVFGKLYKIKNLNDRIDYLTSKLRLSDILNRITGELSSGQKNRASLAKSLINDPKVLLLDEPTANLDPYSLNLIEEIILDENKKGKTIILTTHDMGQAKRLAKEILFFDKGKLLEQTKAINFFTKPKTKEAQNYINGKILL